MKRHKNVVYIDDDPLSCGFFQKTMIANGIFCQVFYNLASIETYIKNCFIKFDIVVSDINGVYLKNDIESVEGQLSFLRNYNCRVILTDDLKTKEKTSFEFCQKKHLVKRIKELLK